MGNVLLLLLGIAVALGVLSILVRVLVFLISLPVRLLFPNWYRKVRFGETTYRRRGYRAPKLMALPRRRSCKKCGKRYWTNRYFRYYCSQACAWQKSYRDCVVCGKEFWTDKHRHKVCSSACRVANEKAQKRIDRSRYRARKHRAPSERIDPIQIMERDNWICRKCGRGTPQRLRGTTDWLAPEIDHIKPLSRGGSHVFDNVQLLCRRCNSEKSDKI
jgi:5-methylcytosine-specific restriction endonuclease McrA